MYHDCGDWSDLGDMEWDVETQSWKIKDSDDDYNLFADEGEVDLSDDDRNMDEADELSTQLYIMFRKEASDYLDGPARDLKSFDGSKNQLLDVFDWNETEQGYSYWEEIFYELVSYGWEDVTRPELEGIEL